MTIIGKNGSVKIGGQYMNEIEVCHIKDYTDACTYGRQIRPMIMVRTKDLRLITTTSLKTWLTR
jgi:hypothetical protein